MGYGNECCARGAQVSTAHVTHARSGGAGRLRDAEAAVFHCSLLCLRHPAARVLARWGPTAEEQTSWQPFTLRHRGQNTSERQQLLLYPLF